MKNKDNKPNDANRPPAGTRRIMRVADLPQERGPKKYIIVNEGKAPKVITLSKRLRQILELLMAARVYCASPVRIGASVGILRDDYGIEIATDRYPGNPITGSGPHGVYRLVSKVSRIVDEVAA